MRGFSHLRVDQAFRLIHEMEHVESSSICVTLLHSVQGEASAGGGTHPEEASRRPLTQCSAAPLHPTALLDPAQARWQAPCVCGEQ